MAVVADIDTDPSPKAIVIVRPDVLMHQQAAPACMANRTLIGCWRSGMAGIAVSGLPASGMGVGMARYPSGMTNIAFLRFGRARMTTVAVTAAPTGCMRIGVRAYLPLPGMTNTTLRRRERPGMATVTVTAAPAGRMRVGVRTDIGFMAQSTTCSRALAGVTIIAMIFSPAGIVGLGTGVCVAGSAGIFLMTNQTVGPIPCGLDAVGLRPPKVVVRNRHAYLMTLPARFLNVTHAAGIIRLSAHGAVSPRPVLTMTGRRGLLIHISMA